MDNMKVYNQVRKPPESAVKQIKGGRYGAAGLSDVNPQWRIEKMTEVYGQYGIGWYVEPVDIWSEHETMFAHILVYTKVGEEWSKPLHGYGGTKYTGNDDDIIKSTITDAFSYACRFLGVAADVWLKQFDTKYNTAPSEPPASATNVPPKPVQFPGKIQASVAAQPAKIAPVTPVAPVLPIVPVVPAAAAPIEQKPTFRLAAPGQILAINDMASPDTLAEMRKKYGDKLEKLPFEIASNTISWIQKGGKVNTREGNTNA